jgi:hypothetical protein
MNLDYIDNQEAQIYVASQSHSSQGVWLPLIYIDMVNGNFSDATLLAQIMYWHICACQIPSPCTNAPPTE